MRARAQCHLCRAVRWEGACVCLLSTFLRVPNGSWRKNRTLTTSAYRAGRSHARENTHTHTHSATTGLCAPHCVEHRFGVLVAKQRCQTNGARRPAEYARETTITTKITRSSLGGLRQIAAVAGSTKHATKCSIFLQHFCRSVEARRSGGTRRDMLRSVRRLGLQCRECRKRESREKREI